MKERMKFRVLTTLTALGWLSAAAACSAQDAGKPAADEVKETQKQDAHAALIRPNEKKADAAELGKPLPPPTDSTFSSSPSLKHLRPLPTDAPEAPFADRISSGSGDNVADAKKDLPPLSGGEPNVPGLEEMVPDGLLIAKAYKTYELLAAVRSDILRLAAGMKKKAEDPDVLAELARKVRKPVDDLAAQWPEEEDFRAICGACKREIITLTDELEQRPRRWRYAQWAFDAALINAGKMRQAARLLAESLPKPVMQTDKHGKPILVLPPDEKTAAAEDEAARRARLRDLEEQKKRWEKRRQGPTFEEKGASAR
jgi:hypothetical protein